MGQECWESWVFEGKVSTAQLHSQIIAKNTGCFRTLRAANAFPGFKKSQGSERQAGSSSMVTASCNSTWQMSSTDMCIWKGTHWNLPLLDSCLVMLLMWGAFNYWDQPLLFKVEKLVHFKTVAGMGHHFFQRLPDFDLTDFLLSGHLKVIVDLLKHLCTQPLNGWSATEVMRERETERDND